MSIKDKDPELADLSIQVGHALNSVFAGRDFLQCVHALAIAVAGCLVAGSQGNKKEGISKEEALLALRQRFFYAVKEYTE